MTFGTDRGCVAPCAQTHTDWCQVRMEQGLWSLAASCRLVSAASQALPPAPRSCSLSPQHSFPGLLLRSAFPAFMLCIPYILSSVSGPSPHRVPPSEALFCSKATCPAAPGALDVFQGLNDGSNHTSFISCMLPPPNQGGTERWDFLTRPGTSARYCPSEGRPDFSVADAAPLRRSRSQ